MPFTVYIDESGDAGIKKVRNETTPGSSPYFVVAAAVMQPATERIATKRLEAFKNEIGKKSWKHATDFSHPNKVYFARRLSELHVRLFAVISNKATLGEYAARIDGDSQKFYNKCVEYLLERVCSYLSVIGAAEENVSVVLERRNHDYDAMLRYLLKVRENPLHSEAKSLTLLNPFSITTRAKGEEPLLEYADFVAHAVFQCVNKTKANHFIPERRYFEEISKRFAGDKSGRIINVGIKCIHDIGSLDLDADVKDVFVRTRVMPPLRG